MEKITIEKLVAMQNEAFGTNFSTEDMMLRINENCVEIAFNHLVDMQNISEYGRDSLIRDFISQWAMEAEEEWIKQRKNGDDIYYYDFIDKFADDKYSEFEAENGSSYEYK